MIIHQDRSGAETQMVTALREVFDAAVSNFGAYNLLYAPIAEPNRTTEAAQRTGLAETTTDEQAVGLTQASEWTEAEPGNSEAIGIGQGAPDAAVVSGYLLGYKRMPPEMIVCPVDANQIISRTTSEHPSAESSNNSADARVPPKPAETPFTVDITNVAGLSIEDEVFHVALSVGRHVRALIQPAVRLLPGDEGLLRQQLDVEDFRAFLDLLMDRMEGA